MARLVPSSALVAFGLAGALASSAAAQGLRAHDPACPLVAFPDAGRFCERPEWMSATGGVALLPGPDGGSELLDIRRVIATFGPAGPTVLRSATTPLMAGRSDVEATGSIAAPERGK